MTHQDTSNGFSSLSLRYLPHNRTLEDIGRQELGGSGAGGGGIKALADESGAGEVVFKKVA